MFTLMLVLGVAALGLAGLAATVVQLRRDGYHRTPTRFA